jgi:AcrR family transcriptional regulator
VPPRKDAVRNRARLVDAAAGAFREGGLGVSVNAIARAAGVNVATLYRHFPTKDHLVDAVLEVVLEPLVAARDHALAHPPTLRTFLREALRKQETQKGLADALGPDVRAKLRDPALEIVAPLVERAHEDGELRPDFGAKDLLIALRMVGAAQDERYVDVVVRGLRPD